MLIFLAGFLTLPVLAQNVEGLVAYWAFDEKEGDTASDSSGNGHNGKLMGDPQWTDDGYLGGALEFDQSGDEVNVPYHPNLNPESFTICAWVNLDSDGRGYRTIVSTRYEFPQKGYILYAGPALDGSGNIWQFWTGNGVFWNIVKGPPFSTGNWEHLAGVYANGIQKLYLNGILVGEISGTLHPNLSEELLIGAGANELVTHTYFFKGKIDEVRLYNRPLNVDEITTVMGSESSTVKRSDPLAKDVYQVRVIYFKPVGSLSTPTDQLTQLIEETQEFYKAQMEEHGYGAKTFRIESNENDEVIIHTVEGKHAPSYYAGNTYEEIEKELPLEFTSANEVFMDNVHVIIVGGVSTVFNGAWGVGWTFSNWQAGGNAIIAGNNLNMPIIAHEIGHAFGLFHNEVNNTMMGPRDGPMLDFEAKWLSKSHYFNDTHIRTDIPEFVDFLGTEAIGRDIIKFKFSAHSDSELFHAKIIRIRGGFVVLGDDELSGKDDIAEIDVPRQKIVNGDKLSFRIIDVNGNYIFKDITYESAQHGPKHGPKIEGPWSWVLVPGKQLSNADLLSEASGGRVTEKTVATEGARPGKKVGNSEWIQSLLPTQANNFNIMLDALDISDEARRNHVIYGSISLNSRMIQETTMFVGADDGGKIWLNGELVYDEFVFGGAIDYKRDFPVTLQQGTNVLLVAVDNRHGSHWSGFFGFAENTEYILIPPVPYSIESRGKKLVTFGQIKRN